MVAKSDGKPTSTRRADLAAAGVAVAILVAGGLLAALTSGTAAYAILTVAAVLALLSGAAMGTHLRGGDVRAQLRWTSLVALVLVAGGALSGLLDNSATWIASLFLALVAIPAIERRRVSQHPEELSAGR